MLRQIIATLACLLTLAAHADPVDEALLGRVGSGTMTESLAALEDIVAANPDDDRARLALGMLKIIKTGETTSQWLYRYGAGNPTRQASVFVFPMVASIPGNPVPQKLTLEEIDRFMIQWMEELDEAHAILAEIKDPAVKLEVDLAKLRFDLNGNGIASDNERAGIALNVLFTGGRPAGGEIPSFVVAADRADVDWMIAYTHVFRAMGEMFLAHDFSNIFNRAGHIIFPNTDTPYEFLQQRTLFDPTMSGLDVTDMIAFFHSLRFEVDEPERMENARQHFLKAIEHSRAMWVYALMETDNDREWLPNPNQDAALRGMKMTDERIRLWRDLLDETEDALTGEKLVRFWRGDGSQGIDLKRVFQEPETLDVLLWIQGTAAAPYLEEGEYTRDFLWRDFEDAFGENPFRYIFYIN